MADVADPAVAFAAMNAVGLVAFAVVGALKGSDADLDLFGVVVLGFLTALGGGMLRDVLVGRVPVALRATGDVLLAAAGVAMGVGLSVWLSGTLRNKPVLLVADALGLAAFAATGAAVGLDAGLSPFGVVVVATLTGVGGGSLSDLLLVRVPAVLREDFYATPAALGGLIAWAGVAVGVSVATVTYAAASGVLLLRLASLWYGWRLPTV